MTPVSYPTSGSMLVSGFLAEDLLEDIPKSSEPE